VEFQHIGVDNLPEPRVLDGYLFGLLLTALSKADRFVVEGPISAKALRNATMFSEAWHCWLPGVYRPVEIVPEAVIADVSRAPDLVGAGTRAIAAFSGGVDSIFTALRHGGTQLGPAAFPVRDFLMVHGFDIHLERERDFRELIERTQPFIDELGATLHIVRTNIKYQSQQDWEHSYGAQIASVLHQFGPNFQYGLIGSGEPYSHLPIAWGSHPGTDHLLSGANFEIVHDGAGFSRTEKVAHIASNVTARRTVKVCWQGEHQGRNCGKCEKCVRTRLNFFAVGVDHPECFDNEFGVAEINRITVSNPPQLSNLEQIIEYADRHQTGGRWLDVLRARIVALRQQGFTQGSNTSDGPAGPTANFLHRMQAVGRPVTEVIRQIGPVWLLTEMPGNIGDHLIWLGTEALLTEGGCTSTDISVAELLQSAKQPRPGTLVIPGSGALTVLWNEWLPELVQRAAGGFDRVLILPSEYEPEVPAVGLALSQPNVYAFARDAESFRKIRSYGRAALAMDPALWAMEFVPPTTSRTDEDLGNVLLALRTDVGSCLPQLGLRPSAENNDISASTGSLPEFLECVKAVDTVVTDRLHVAVAAIMLGKHVRFPDLHNRKISRYIEYNFADEFSERIQQRSAKWLLERCYAEISGQ
jgi:exopolysaccharide biosynthesis predicted pyruvyltransferase EpsI